MGLLCDQCEDGYWNMEGASGCQPCSCDPASALSYVCDKASAREAGRLFPDQPEGRAVSASMRGRCGAES